MVKKMYFTHRDCHQDTQRQAEGTVGDTCQLATPEGSE